MTDSERNLLIKFLLFYWNIKDTESARKAAERIIKDFENNK